MPSEQYVPGAIPGFGIAADRAGLSHSPYRVGALHKLAVVAGVSLRACWLALRTRRNPLRALRALPRLRAMVRTRPWSAPAADGAKLRTSQRITRASGRYFWELYLPGWPSAAFDRCIERELDRVDPTGRPPGLNVAIVAITRRCALRCEHCVEWDVLNRREAMSAADLHEVVRRVQRRGTGQFFFSGGEPLHRFADLLSLASAVSGESDAWVLSSGLGLSAARAQRLRDAGITGIMLSLDHWDGASHDRFRGLPGSFAAATRAAGHARDAGLLVGLSLCATRPFATRDNLGRYAELARTLGAAFIQVIEPRALGHYADEDVALGPVHRQALEDFCAWLNSDAAGSDYPTAEYPDWGKREFGCCGAGDRYAYVDTDGELHACPFCRAPGLRVLDHDIDSAISALQARGCPATRSLT